MEGMIGEIQTYIAPVWAWFQEGLNVHGPTAAEGINWMTLGIQMGVIALVMALLMQSYGAILIFTVVGTVVHVVVDQVLPMVREGAAFSMPPVTAMDYWQYLAFLGTAYLVGITVFAMIKAILFRGG